jgi:S-formylglutathione hydrolase FrmB
MTMQYDVKSYHNTVSGLAVPYRARLKGVLISPTTSVAFNTVIVDDVAQTGTYNVPGSTTCTVTITAHGLTTGDRVYLDFTSGTAADDAYAVTVLTENTFTVAVTSATTSGNVTMYANILTEIDCANGTSFYTLIPGEGVLATTGIRVFLPSANVTSTIFYG